MFLSPSPVAYKDLARKLKVSEEEVRAAARDLAKDYNGAVRILIEEDWAFMTLRQEYAEALRDIPSGLSKLELKVAGLVLKNPGITKKRVVGVLHSGAYGAIKRLVIGGYIKEVKEGRTTKLYPTKLLKGEYGVS